MLFDIERLAANLKKYRTAKKITQQELAEKLMVSPQSVSKWECAKSLPELDKLCAVAEILNVSLDALLDKEPLGSNVLVGVDGGGTKTEFVLFREDGKLLKRLVLGGANPNIRGFEHCLSLMKEGLNLLLDAGQRLCGLYIGCAGFFSGNYGLQVKEALQKLYPKAKIDCCSDAMNIIACGSNSKQCIAAICGTGSVVYANKNRTLHRLGGAGYLLDKKGSGFDIGQDVLRAALLERDGIGASSLITPLVEEQLGSSVWDAIDQIYREGTSFIASFAPIAFEAYAQQDTVAESILREHADHLAHLIQAASKMYGCGKTVVLSGSMFTATDVFLKMLQEALTVDLQIEVPNLPPVYGACVLACELCGISQQALTDNFEQQYPLLKQAEKSQG